MQSLTQAQLSTIMQLNCKLVDNLRDLEKRMYIDRHITGSFKELINQFPSVLISGQRQVGKSTLLKHIAGEEYNYLTFDDPLLVKRVKEDPHLFMLDHPGKLILDEIQLAPELFPYLKMEIDRTGENWQIFIVRLTGISSDAACQRIHGRTNRYFESCRFYSARITKYAVCRSICTF